MIPKQLLNLKFCRIKRGTKKPFEESWTTKPYSMNEIEMFIPNENYGVICGYENLAVIDCDKDSLKEIVASLLPQTFSVKTGSGGMHFYYFIPELKKKVILDLNGEHLGEVQSYGSQVVGAGSIHPNGNTYEIVNNVGIKTITLKELNDVVGRFMKSNETIIQSEDVKEYEQLVNEIVKVWKEGDRQELALSVSGYLRKERRLGINKVKNIISRVCELTKDEEVAMRLRAAEETFKKDEKDIKGFTGLGKIIIDKKENPFVIFTRDGQVEEFNKLQPIFYDKSKNFWLWNKERFMWEMTDEIEILNMINKSMPQINIINSKERQEIINALKQIGRKYMPKEIKKSWVQFQDKNYDVKTGEIFAATPEYFVRNPIPWNVGESSDTPTIDKLIEDWVDEEYVPTIYQLIAYSICPDRFMQRLIALVGGGSNGKGTFIKLLYKFLGEENCVSSDLKLISENQFETATIYGKLLVVFGEVSYDDLRNTNTLKQIAGEDKLRFCFKGKTPFTDKNTSMGICLTNSLPATPDKSEGFYRRWMIIDFPNQFKSISGGIVDTIPPLEFENLAYKSLWILKSLYNNPSFINEGTFEERASRFEERSNPVMKFMEENYEEGDGFVPLKKFANHCNEWLRERHLRRLSVHQIGKILRNEGFDVSTRKNGNVSYKSIINLTLLKPLKPLNSSVDLHSEMSEKVSGYGGYGDNLNLEELEK